MIWTVLAIVLVSIIKLLVTCLPTGPVEWLIRKFEIHSKLNEAEATITLDGRRLEGEAKSQVIHEFNEALFLKKHYIFPGTEEAYLYPEDSEAPLVIDTKKGMKDVRLFVYRYHDHVDIIKQSQKKVVAYSLLSDRLQKLSV